MSKNIVLLSDGTGNSSSKIFKTNVWRLFQALDLKNPESQIAYYDDGVGTSSFKLLAYLGGIFGIGLKRNVIDIYSFCSRNYAEGDKIYGFGFSRGAFTIRVVAGFIARVGLVRYDGNEAHLARDAEIAYREYRKVRNFKSGGNLLVKPLRKLRDWVSHVIFRKPTFEQLEVAGALVSIDKFDFLGVWDYRRCLWRPDRGNYARDRLLVLAAVDAGSVHDAQGRPGMPCAGAGGGARCVSPGAMGRSLCARWPEFGAGQRQPDTAAYR